jgi:dTDP-4-dehydrorhamnose 3,5-epimerase-like enzyme
VAGAQVVTLPELVDHRGTLSYGQVGAPLPFTPRRYFVIYGVRSGQVRGAHAHREVEQFMVCVSGAVTLVLDDGSTTDEVRLDSPAVGVLVPPLVWNVTRDYTPDAVLLVLASDVYREEEYIRDYSAFLAAAAAGRAAR